jgi:putative transferase (TIGR04331 family)
MFLITTANQQFWPNRGPVLFLGEWCKLYSQKHVYERLESQTLAYHWDDRARLYSDYQYLGGVYEKYLDALVSKLNDVHRVSHSHHFWRIVIGPWLRYFIEIFYDRYLSIRAAADRGCVSDTLIADTSRIAPPLDFPEFNNLFASDSYNHKLYSWLIERTQCLPFHKISTQPEPADLESYKSSNRDVVAGLISRVARFMPAAWTRISLLTTQLPAVELLRLNKALRQFPRPAAPPIRVRQRRAPNPSLRHELLLESGNTSFEKLLDVAIAEHIPFAHVEEFEDLRVRAHKAYPQWSKVIVTSAAETFDEAFKIWTASQVDEGSAFAMSQHGGSFGACLWMSTEDHQIAISKRFYTWGWPDDTNPSVKPMPAFKLVGIEKRIRWSNSGRILWALASCPRYSFRMMSIPVAGQLLSYLEEQFRLASALPPQVRDRITVRLYPERYGWEEGLRWRERFPDIEIDDGSKNMEKLLSRSSLLISTYNATTFLETLSADFPTIIFWNPLYWELRPDAQRYYDVLQNVGIFHTSPESAASQINEVYKDTQKWWKRPAVQEARLQFCERFARTRKDWLREWSSELTGLNRSHG